MPSRGRLPNLIASQAAQMAVDAWGGTLMRGHDCCVMPGSLRGHGFAWLCIWLGVFQVDLVCSFCVLHGSLVLTCIEGDLFKSMFTRKPRGASFPDMQCGRDCTLMDFPKLAGISPV